MSSTNTTTDKLFRESVLGVESWRNPVGTSSGSETYFRERPQPRVRREDFELASYRDAEGLQRGLSRLWDPDGSGSMREVVAAHAAAAVALRDAATSEASGEVSPLVYVMF